MQKKQCECQFPSSALGYPQQVYLECSQISPACPSDKSSTKKISVEYWWNDTGREKPQNSEKKLSECHFVYHKSHVA